MAYVWCHGDPYVFPAGFAEQEHVHVRPVQQQGTVGQWRLGHPDTEYEHRPQAAVLEQARAHADATRGSARRP